MSVVAPGVDGMMENPKRGKEIGPVERSRVGHRKVASSPAGAFKTPSCSPSCRFSLQGEECASLFPDEDQVGGEDRQEGGKI